MAKKKGYFSKTSRVVLFSIMMTFLLACLIISIYMIVDATRQASEGHEYIVNYELSFALTFIYVSTGVYGVFYFITLMIYIANKDKIPEESSIKIKSNGTEDKETLRLRKTFDAEVIEENAPEVGAPLFSYTESADEVDEAAYKSFIRFLMLRSTILVEALIFVMAGLVCILIPYTLSAALILLGMLLVAAVLAIINTVSYLPNRMYKKTKKNPVPTLIRIYDNRIEEVTSLMSGSEIIYVCKYDFSAVKETEKYLYIKSRNEKAIVGIMVSKEKAGQENVNLILNKISAKSM